MNYYKLIHVFNEIEAPLNQHDFIINNNLEPNALATKTSFLIYNI